MATIDLCGSHPHPFLSLFCQITSFLTPFLFPPLRQYGVIFPYFLIQYAYLFNLIKGSHFTTYLQKNDENQYLHIDLLHLHRVTRVATQGKFPVPGCTVPDAWVTSYMVQFRQDMADWQNYTEGGVVRVSQFPL